MFDNGLDLLEDQYGVPTKQSMYRKVLDWLKASNDKMPLGYTVEPRKGGAGGGRTPSELAEILS